MKKILRKVPRNRIALATYIVVFAVFGILFLFLTPAASPSASFESESGTLVAPATIATDSSASGGSLVKFGNANISPPTSTEWQLEWSDEFNGSAVDETKWNIQTGTLDYDQGCYRGAKDASNNPTGNLEVTGGNLIIRTKYEPGKCADAYVKYPSPSGKTAARPYTTAYIRSDAVGSKPDRFVISPTVSPKGIIKFEFNAQMPTMVRGLWPALWSRNEFSDTSSTATNPYGEIDIIELWGDEPNNFTFRTTTHNTNKQTGGDTGYVSKPSTCPIASTNTALKINCSDLSTAMRKYGVEIDSVKGEVRYYLDDRLVALNSATSSPGFNATQWLNAIKNKWDLRVMTQIVDIDYPYHPEPDSTFKTSELKVDYVRVYSKL